VSYSFEFVAHSAIQSIKTTIKSAGTSGNTDKSVISGNRTIIVGDTVVCNGYAYYDSYGANPHSAKMTSKTMCVTHVNYKGTHPVHVGSVGWMRLQDVSLSNTASTPKSSNNYTTYVVKAGDTLSAIGIKYNVPWKKIASFNHIKNPNLIYAGTTLKIPK